MSTYIPEMINHPLLRGTQYRLVTRQNLDEKLAASMVKGLAQFLVVLAAHRKELSPPTLIDTAWHEALIDTKHYAEFCEEFFGVFLHHHPPHGIEDIRPENLTLTATTVELARKQFGDEIEAVVWRRSKRVQAISHT